MTALLEVVADIKGSPLTVVETERLLVLQNLTGVVGCLGDVDLVGAIAEHLEREEGRVRHAYHDHLGFLIIGVGRLVDERRGGGLDDAEIDLLLANDIRARMAALADWPAWERVRHDPPRATALVAMSFQMGVDGLTAFTNTLAATDQGRFEDAASAMLDSRWARQTPGRARRVAAMMRTGRA